VSIPILLTLLLAGFVVLLVTADYLIRGAAAMARRWGIPKLLVGLTIVAFGTSAPELAVSVDAVLEGEPDVALANIVGSNIANVLLILGVPALIFGTIHTTTPGLRRNAVVAVAATFLVIGLAWFGFNGYLIARDGLILLAVLAVYLLWLYRDARKPGLQDPQIAELTDFDEMSSMPKSWSRIAVMILIGVIGLPVGAIMIVEGGIGLAEAAGVPPYILGLTLFALGTSLPELAASVISAARGHAEVAIGNVLGSNLFNILAVGGVASLVGPLPVPAEFFVVDFWVMLAATALLALLIFARARLTRLTGLLMLAAYGAYMVWIASHLPPAAGL